MKRRDKKTDNNGSKPKKRAKSAQQIFLDKTAYNTCSWKLSNRNSVLHKKNYDRRFLSPIKMSSLGQFNFSWLFAILAGGAILFLAIFGAMKASDTAGFQSDTETAKQISILADPLQAGFAESSFGSMAFKKETRIDNVCFPEGFGKNEISVATESSVGGAWTPSGAAIAIYNKYLFSEERISGKYFYMFSKPFRFPYKVADLIFMTSKNYCFSGAGSDYNEIKEEIKKLGIPNIETEGCVNPDAIKVCFTSSDSDCDIIVSGTCADNSKCDSIFDKGKVIKSSEVLYYVGNLMFAAIFSDETTYNCNVERLFYRAEKIAEELVLKSNIMDCSPGMNQDLNSWKSSLNLATSQNIQSLITQSNNLENKNEGVYCKLW